MAQKLLTDTMAGLANKFSFKPIKGVNTVCLYKNDYKIFFGDSDVVIIAEGGSNKCISLSYGFMSDVSVEDFDKIIIERLN